MAGGDADRVFTTRKLSDRVWVTRETDTFGESPLIYCVRGRDKIVVIDTGCGSADLRTFLRSIPGLGELPFLVVNTHVHYDHIMGNHCFCRGSDALRDDCLGVCQGARDTAFSQRWTETSLQGMVGAAVQPFCVTRWLQEGDCIDLDDTAERGADGLEVIYTPGHTPDSISLYLSAEHRLFTGDLVYPGGLYLFLPGSSIVDFENSITKLRQRWSHEAGDNDDASDGRATSSAKRARQGDGPVMSCGHNDSDLGFEALSELAMALPAARTGNIRLRKTTLPWFSGELVALPTKTFVVLCRPGDLIARAEGGWSTSHVDAAQEAASVA